MTIELNVLQTTGLAMLLFVLGRFIVNHVGFLRRCCIPAPVVGGLIFAIFHLVVHQTGLLTLTFDETLKNVFMIWFFTSVGYGASFKVLRRGAGPVLVFLLLLPALYLTLGLFPYPAVLTPELRVLALAGIQGAAMLLGLD